MATSLDDSAIEMSYDFASRIATIVLAKPVEDHQIIGYFRDLSLEKVNIIEVWVHSEKIATLNRTGEDNWTKHTPCATNAQPAS